jgi:prolyl oligopeptidase
MTPRIVSAFALAVFVFAFAPAPARAADAPPVAAVHAVTDTLWGVPVADPYRYMENTKDPEFQAWMKGEATYAAEALSRIPGRDELLARIQEYDAGRPFRVFNIHRLPDGRLFYQRIAAEENLAKLWLRPAKGGKERVLIDPATKAVAGGGHWSIDFYSPSPDGAHIAYGLAARGSEQTTLFVLDVASGKTLPDSIDRLENAYTDPQWVADGSGFFYQRRRALPADAPETEIY